MLHQALRLLSALYLTVLCLPGSEANVCGNRVVWRNENYQCPMRAICADVFTFTRDWYNGTTCQERRILNNCMCPGNMACPVDSAAHKIQATRKHSRYLCEPVCRLPRCAEVSFGRGPVTAFTSLQNSPLFHNYTYQRLDCRCPGHMRSTLPRYFRSIRAFRHGYNVTTGTFNTLYKCNTQGEGGAQFQMDPCDL